MPFVCVTLWVPVIVSWSVCSSVSSFVDADVKNSIVWILAVKSITITIVTITLYITSYVWMHLFCVILDLISLQTSTTKRKGFIIITCIIWKTFNA